MRRLTYEEKLARFNARESAKTTSVDVITPQSVPGKPTQKEDPYKWADVRKARWHANEERRFAAAKLRDPWAWRKNPPEGFPSELHPVGFAKKYKKYLAYTGPIENMPNMACGCDGCRFSWVIEMAGEAGAMAALQVKAETGKWPWDGGE